MTVRSLFPILMTPELPELARFYEAALGARVAYRFPDVDGGDAYVSLDIDGVALGIARDPGASVEGDRVALWFYVDHLDAVYAAWLAAGGTAVDPPAEMPWGERVGRVRDPAGNLVSLGVQPAEEA